MVVDKANLPPPPPVAVAVPAATTMAVPPTASVEVEAPHHDIHYHGHGHGHGDAQILAGIHHSHEHERPSAAPPMLPPPGAGVGSAAFAAVDLEPNPVDTTGNDAHRHHHDAPAPAPVAPPPAVDAAPRPRKRPRPARVVNRQVLRTHDNDNEKLETNRSLLECAARLDGAVAELWECAATLADPSPGRAGRRDEALRNIRESIVPMLHVASRFLDDTGMSFAPVGATRSLHLRSEARRRRDVVDVRSGRSHALQMIDDFVARSAVEVPARFRTRRGGGGGPTASAEAADGSDGDGRASAEGEGRLPPDEETVTVALPRPLRGDEYCKSEALRAAKMYQVSARVSTRHAERLRSLFRSSTTAAKAKAKGKNAKARRPWEVQLNRTGGLPPAHLSGFIVVVLRKQTC